MQGALILDNTARGRGRHGLASAFGFSVMAGFAKEADMTKVLRTAVLIAVMGAGQAVAQVPLNQDTHLTESLVAGKVADTIRNTCSSISARMFTVLGKLNDLEDYARGQGYAEADVKAFLKNKTEKARIKGLALSYLKTAGAVEGDEESYCKVGRAEIAKGSLAGSLLKSWK